MVDTYYQSRILREPLPSYEPSLFAPDSLLDELLAPSRGLLLWQFQLAQLAGLPRPNAIDLRKHVNQKRPGAFGALRDLHLPSGLSLAGVVEERLLYEGTVPGQWSAAKALIQRRSALLP